MTFIDFVIKNNVIGFFEDKLLFTSGRQSHWYSNWRNVFCNTELLNLTLVECLTPDKKTWKLYELTELGREVITEIRTKISVTVNFLS